MLSCGAGICYICDMINDNTEKLAFLRGKISLDFFVLKKVDCSQQVSYLSFDPVAVREHDSWFDATWFMTPEEAETQSGAKDWHVEHMDISLYRDAQSADEGRLYLQCCDGTLHFSRKTYHESELVRDLIDNNADWISKNSMRDVADELEELYMK